MSTYFCNYHVVGPVKGAHPLPNNDNLWLVYCPSSVTLYEVDEKFGRALRLNELGYAFSEISRLTGWMKEEVKKNVETFNEVISTKSTTERAGTIKPSNLWFFLSTACNMKCTYCYASGGTFRFFPRQIMPKSDVKDVVKKIVDLLGKDIKSVSYFGGEPLLGFETMVEITDEIKRNGIYPKYSVVTNGTLMNKDIIDYLKKNNFAVTVSIDGPPLLHDYHRRFAESNKRSYEIIYQNFSVLKGAIKEIAIEATYTQSAFESGYSLTDIADFLSKLSQVILLKKVESFPMLSAEIPQDKFVNNPFFYEMTKDYVHYILSRMTSNEPLFDVALTRAISTIINRQTSAYPCGFKSHLTIFPDKSLYSCHLLTNKILRICDNINILKPNHFWQRYHEIENYVIKQFEEIKCTPKVWFSAFQDLCAAALIPITKDVKKFRLRLYEFLRYESYFWDIFLQEIYKIRNDDERWSVLLKNLNAYPGGLNVP